MMEAVLEFRRDLRGGLFQLPSAWSLRDGCHYVASVHRKKGAEISVCAVYYRTHRPSVCVIPEKYAGWLVAGESYVLRVEHPNEFAERYEKRSGVQRFIARVGQRGTFVRVGSEAGGYE